MARSTSDSAGRRTVAVIGAGASGITAIKCCLDEGLSPTCFEADEEIGGLWRYTDAVGHSAIYKSTVINTSKEMMSYSDLPIPPEFPPYMHNRKCFEYLLLYAEHFGVRQHIRFRTTVLAVARADDGRWTVRVRNETTGEVSSRWAKLRGRVLAHAHAVRSAYDAVMVCSGHHWDPNIVSFPGEFSGTIIHSKVYKDPTPFIGKRVVIVGVGNSGGDLAVELCTHAASVHLSTRSGVWVLPRVGFFGAPLDHQGNTRVLACAPRLVKQAAEYVISVTTFGKPELYGLNPKHRIDEQHPTVNGYLCGHIITGEIKVARNIARFEGSTVIFEDGARVEADVVILATGYNINFPFLRDASTGVAVVENHVHLYKYVFPTSTDVRNPLALIGLIQPLGAIMPISEMQSRWVAAIVAGHATLPSAEEMELDINSKAAEVSRQYKTSRRHTIQVDYVPFMDEIASLIGAKPALWRLLVTRPTLWAAVVLGPCTPVQYRLHGRHSWPGAASAIKDMPSHIYDAVGGQGARVSPQSARGRFMYCVVVPIVLLLIFVLLLAVAIALL